MADIKYLFNLDIIYIKKLLLINSKKGIFVNFLNK